MDSTLAAVTWTLDFVPVSSKEFLDFQAISVDSLYICLCVEKRTWHDKNIQYEDLIGNFSKFYEFISFCAVPSFIENITSDLYL